ncbi:uncharacterized protein LOC129963093 isoform X3 [Argiope bruennichi]|uniref:uncharacterized protein LOC129963093 isoform X3 n=1 Tax=Argiope bruennichi TaxID=94029 RepID=UPI0024942E99|nr:uncharacterized protein LOC129963093 isoform X3 [Argiope bruennichi]
MSGTPPDSPEVEEGSPFGGAECDDSDPEPAQQISEDHEQGEENFPFVNVAVELYEGPDGDASAKEPEQNNEISDDSLPKSPEVENVETTPDLNLHIGDEEERDDVPDSTGPDMNEDSAVSDAYATTVIRSEPFEPDYKQLHKTYIEDFIYSNASSFDEGSNSNFDDSRDEPKGSSLSKFPKIVKAVEQAEYETLQVLFQLLYQRSAWDTQEVLAHGILEFSGFNFGPNSEDYFNREMLLRTQPDEMLAKIGILLGLDHQVQKMLTDLQKARPELISGIMYFLSRPSRKTRFLKSGVDQKEEVPSPTASQKRLVSKCGCRNNCMLQFTKVERNRLLEYSKELDQKKLLESYLVNLMECKKIKRTPQEIENSKKLKEVCYSYTVKFDTKEVNVCKGGFCLLHGLKLGRVSQLQNRVKTGMKLPKQMDMKDFPPIISEEERKLRQEIEAKKAAKKSSPKKKQPQSPAQSLPKKVWVSSEEQIRRMEKELNGNIDKSCAALPKVLLEKIDVKMLQKNSVLLDDKDLNSVPAEKPTPEKQPEDTKPSMAEEKKTVKLKDFPLVVKAVEDAPQELLVDVHFLLFLTSADDDEVKKNILEFEGFSFDSDTEEYDERNEFLQRMTFKIVCDVARTFSLAVMNTKEETVKNILKFLSKPDESFLTTTVSMPLSLSDVELDDLGDLSDSDASITCEVVEKKVECIDLLSSGEDSDGEGKSKSKSPKKSATSTTSKPSTSTIVQTTVVSSITQVTPTTTTATTSTVSQSNNNTSGKTRCLRDFETIGKIVNTHPHEYLVDIFELLYLKKHDPATLRDDILNFTGFTFEMKSPEYIKRKQLLDRMLYNSVRRIYNTLIHNTTEVKVFSKPTMITEIFQFLFNLPDHDTSVRPPPTPKPITKPIASAGAKLPTPGITPPAGLNLPNQSGKLSDLKRVFQRVACFPCEYLTDVHKLLFMTECDAKVIRQNIFAFKGFNFDVDSQEFQQRKMYLEYLTFHSLRKISSVLTTRSVDLRNSTKHELATHLTQVLAEYTKLKVDEDVLPPGIAKPTNQTEVTSTSSVSSTTPVENIVVTPAIYPNVENSSSGTSSTANTPVNSQAASTPLAISIVDARSVSPTKNTPSSKQKRKRKSTPTKQAKQKASEPATSFADVNLPEVEQYKKLYGQNLNAYQAPITGIAVVPVVSNYNQPIAIQGMQQPSQLIIPQTIAPTIVTQVTKTEVIVPEKNADSEEPSAKRTKNKSEKSEENTTFQTKIRDAATEDEDCDKPLASLVGHPIDSVLKKHIVDIVEQSDLESITINGVIQKIFNMYPKFDLSYRKEFIKQTLRSILYRLGEEKNSSKEVEKRDTDSPDCCVTTTDNSENISESAMECC